MRALAPLVLAMLAMAHAQPVPARVRALHNQYGNIFRTNNRNAASHLWVSHVLQKAKGMSRSAVDETMSGFCAISGSPVNPHDYNRYLLRLPLAGSEKATVAGFMHYCCWPCVCDTQDFLVVDTLAVETADGPENMHFVAMGDPCVNPSALTTPFKQPFGYRTTTLELDAPEVRCDEEGRLVGATYTDNGLVAIGAFFPTDEAIEVPTDSPEPGRISKLRNGTPYQDETEYAQMCYDRELRGHDSGMGDIFRKVAGIAPTHPPSTRCSADGASCQVVAR